MRDKKGTINALKTIVRNVKKYDMMTIACDDYFVKTLEDALELLKEQEEKQTPKPIVWGYKEEYWGEEEICPDCGKHWMSADVETTHFCPGCGRPVKWK